MKGKKTVDKGGRCGSQESTDREQRSRNFGQNEGKKSLEGALQSSDEYSGMRGKRREKAPA